MANDELLPVVTAHLLDQAELDATIRTSLAGGTALLPLDGPVEPSMRYAVELYAPGVDTPTTIVGSRDGDECGSLVPMRLEPMEARPAFSPRTTLGWGEIKDASPERKSFIGTLIGGKYSVEAELGRGAMGTVYRATHLTLRKPVAVKVLNRSLRDEGTFVERFHREALAVSGLDHPNLVRVLDFGEDTEGAMYIAMDLLEGRDLARALGGQVVSVHRIVDLMAQVCSALAAAHDLGIVHRDIKPENIMLATVRNDDGIAIEQVKVCDFGIARTSAPEMQSSRLTQNNAIMGTPAYMAPEQAAGAAVDGRADIYACGVVLYELATGRLPFEGDSAAELLVAHASREPPRPSTIVPAIDPRLEAIILKAIEKNPERRFTSARELRSALRSLVMTSNLDASSPRMVLPASAPMEIAPILPVGEVADLEDDRPAAVIIDAAESIEVEGEAERQAAYAAQATAAAVSPSQPPPGLDEDDSTFSDFFLALTGAVARTTYYDREHPEFGRAMVRLSGVVSPPLRGRREISFARQETYEGPRITVMTGLGELYELRKLLSHSAYSTFGPHFVDVLQRRQVVTITLREGVSVEELGDLVEILCGPEIPVAEVRAKFQARGFTRTSLLFSDDLLGRDRKLPWHVDVCISRLARDLRLLPMLRNIDPERLREFRTQLVCDVVRPLRNPDQLRMLLANGDLIQKALHDGPGGESLENVTETIVNALPQVMCLQVANVVLAELERDAARGQAGASAATPLVRMIGERFIRQRTVESDEVLRVLHERAVLSFPELPADLQLWVLAEQQARELCTDAERVLRSLDTTYDESRYAREARTLSRAMRVLARRAEFKTLFMVIARLERHARGATPGEASREELAAQALQSARDPEMLRSLATAFLAGAQDLRDSARGILGTAGQDAAEALCVAREKEIEAGTPVRARFVEATRDLGADAIPAIDAALARVEVAPDGAPAQYIEDLLRAIPEIANGPLGDRVEPLLRHASPGIRRAATTALTALWGKGARDALVRELDDADEGVRIAALHALRRLGVIDADVIHRIERTLSDTVRASPELRSVAAACLAHADDASRERAIAILSRALEPRATSFASLVRAAVGTGQDDDALIETLARTIVRLAGDVGRKRVEARARRCSPQLRARLLAILAKPQSV